MEQVKLNFVMIGKAGQGKSATGNSILDRRAFKVNNHYLSRKDDLAFNFSQFQNYSLLVVDGIRLDDYDEPWTNNMAITMDRISKAFSMSYGGVDAFLLVIAFGKRFTQEDKISIETLKLIFGDTFMSHVIVIVTYGDIYEITMEEEGLNSSFNEWCQQQTGAFRELYEDCKKRFVLFNNRERDADKKQAEIQQLVQLACSLQKSSGQYTSKCFDDAKAQPETLMLKIKALHLRFQFQDKIALLNTKIEHLSKRSTGIDKVEIGTDLQNLKRQIKSQDQHFGKFDDLLDQVKRLEKTFVTVDTAQRLATLLEHTVPVSIMRTNGAMEEATVGQDAKISGGFASHYKMDTKEHMSEASTTAKYVEQHSQDVQTRTRSELQTPAQMEKLNYLLLGRTNECKSSTGNTILNSKVFTTVTCKASSTSDVQKCSAEFGQYFFEVVNGPAIINDNLSYVESVTAGEKNMAKALELCDGSVDAFLFVIKFGQKMDADDRLEIQYLKRMFGDTFIEHVILVVTHGDLSPDAKEGSISEINLHDWSINLDQDLLQLYDGCKGRVLLFNNMETDESKMRTQKQRLAHYAQDIIHKYGRYTTERFEIARAGRERLILELKTPILRLQIQEKINKLAARVEQLSQDPPHDRAETIKKVVEELKSEIQVLDGGHTALVDMLEKAEMAGNQLEKVSRRQRLP